MDTACMHFIGGKVDQKQKYPDYGRLKWDEIWEKYTTDKI